MRNILFLLILVGLGLAAYLMIQRPGGSLVSPLVKQEVKKELPLEKYSFVNLSKRNQVTTDIRVVDEKFYYRSEGRQISGAIKYPEEFNNQVKYPVIVMARGYVEKEGYATGMGTKNAAAYYAQHGYISLAPDFSGYGESDPEDSNALGARLSKPVEILDLLTSLKPLSYLDLDRVYLWGHSNGGQIMLSVAEIIGMRNDIQVQGLTLWAPVTKPFPYNILYYTDEASDSGKWLRKRVSEFEEDYDVFNFSVDKYLDSINIPILIHQGSADEAVPKRWSDEFVKILKEKEKQVEYYVYPGTDHNMRPSWDSVVARDIEWFNKLMEERK